MIESVPHLQRSGWHPYVTALLDLIYPRSCESCETSLNADREGARRWLCDPCHDALPRLVPPFCGHCGEPYDGAIIGSFRCGNCADLKLHFDFAISAYQADAAVRELIHRFKYEKQLHLRRLLAWLTLQAWEDTRLQGLDASQGWLLVPVPLHATRRREREYNQSWELCRELAKLTRLPAVEILQRNRRTPPQATLSRNQRIQNLRGAFAVKPRLLRRGTLRGRSILLVDDVLTTGSTASECARVLLRSAGVEKVVVITVARG